VRRKNGGEIELEKVKTGGRRGEDERRGEVRRGNTSEAEKGRVET